MNNEIINLLNILNINYDLLNKLIIQKYNITTEQVKILISILIMNLLYIQQNNNNQAYKIILFYRNLFYNIFVIYNKSIIKQVYICLNTIKKSYEYNILNSIKNILIQFKKILYNLTDFDSITLNIFYNQSKIILNKFQYMSNNIIFNNIKIINKLSIDIINDNITLYVHDNSFSVNNENINIILGIVSTNINILNSYLTKLK